MNQTLHIFRKDFRRLRWEILAALALTALFACAQSRYPWHTLYGRALSILDLSFIVLLAWFYLIARVVHEEPLVGDNAFWLSRPYSRKSLLAAKILFIAVFVSLPALAAEWTILKAGGFSPVAQITQLLTRQAVLAALVLLPAAALAAMTRGLVQFTLAGLAAALYALVYFLLPTYTSAWLISYGIAALLLLVATLVILILQYGWRRKRASLAVVVCTGILILLFVLPLPFVQNPVLAWEYPTPTSVAGGSTVSLDFDSSQRYQPDPEETVGASRSIGPIVGIPFRIHGVAQGTGLQLDEGTVSIEDPRTGSWHSNSIRTASWLPSMSEGKNSADLYFAHARIYDELFEQFKSKPATLRISLLLTLFQEQSSPVRVDAHSFATLIPNVGTCFFEQTGARLFSNDVLCRSPLDRPEMVWIRAEPDSLCTLSLTGTPPPDVAEYRRRMSEAKPGLYVFMSPYNPVNMASILRRQQNPLSSSSLLNPVKKFWLKLPNPEFDWKDGHVHAGPCAGTQLVFTTRKPVAHFRRELEIHDVRLIDYTHD